MSTSYAMSQSKSLWQKQTIRNTQSVKQSKLDLPRTQTFVLNTASLKQALSQAPQRGKSTTGSNLILSFPNENGEFERFRIYEASVMHPELAARYPEIKSYAGQGIDDPTAVIRFSVTPLGFQSMRLSANKSASFIEAITDDASVYSVFTRANRINFNDDFECSVTESMNRTLNSDNSMEMRNADDGVLRTYRLVVSATGEYTNYHGGTKALALAAIVQTMVRVNGIFEVDFNVNMELLANTDDVIFINSGTDPYTTTGAYNGQLQGELTSTIGEANYDIGHLFANLQNNGNAGCIGCVCVNNQKGSGWTSATVPEGEFFDVDYVAHEMGHQFGANHTWTHGGNEGTNVQMEPGSGTTIMSYAGITGATDVAPNVTPNFHAASIEQVTDYVKSTSCQTETITGNAIPVVNAGADYTIPKGTAFELDGSATDADAPVGSLSYCWEQMDENNASSTYPSTTATTGVAFRAYEPTTTTSRYLPRLETIKTGATSWQWEAVPDVARTLNFRLTVRDNVAGGGTNSSDDMIVTVNGTAGPFVVNSPNTNVTWNADSFQTITWDVAGTTGNGVNAANVDIFLSIDGGDTYPITLATGVSNDGSHDIIVPNNQGTQNRVMVRGENHIFFDISDTNFTIAAPIPCTASVPTSYASSNVGATAATLTWDTITAVVFDIQYRVVGSGTWIDVSTSNTPFDLTGLTPETDYETQIRSRCPDNSTSAYSGIITFTTTAIPPCTGTQITSYPYLETFDSGLGDWYDIAGDDGDWILNSGGTPSGNTGPSDDITVGGNYLFLEASSNGSPGEIGAGSTAIFESPCFDLNGLTTATLSFYHHMFGVDAGTIAVEVSIDNGASWSNIFTISGNQGDVWNSESIDLATYLNQNIKLRFIGTTGGGFASDIAIDHIGIGPDTEAPVITLNGASTINLNVGSSYTELGATATDNIDGDLTSSIVVGGDTVDPNLIGTYLVTYNVSDAAGNPAIEVIRTVNVTAFQYCDSFGDLLYQTGVTRVIFGTIDNVDGSPKDVGYEDFTNISTDVTQGTNVDLTVHVDTDGNFVVHAFVWIDWNQDGDFDDSGEEYDLGDIQGVADGALPTLSIAIPESMNFGNTRMRVSAQYNADPTSCLTDFDGEVEDYTVNVKYDGLLYSGGTWDPNAPSGTTTADNVLILDGTYNVNSADISINNLTVNSGATINVDKANNITVAGNINVMSNGVFTLNSDSNEFSSLLVDGTVMGDVEYKRHVTSNSGGNDIIAPPVSGEAFTSFISNNSNVFANSGQTLYLFGPFEKPLNDYGLFSNVEAVNLEAAKGYRAASTNDDTFTFTGAVTTGPLTVPIIHSGTDYAKWNLIGNPYTSYIKLEDFLSANLNELDPNTVAVYGYDADLTFGTEWTIWNMAYSDNNPGALIAPGQGFFVSSKVAGSNVSFTPSMRSTGTTDDFIAGRNANLAHFVITMSKPDRTYNTDIYFKDNATLGLNIGYDAELFSEEPSTFSIYTELTESGQDLNMAIQTIGFDDVNGTTVIPVGINLLQGQQVTIGMDTSDLQYNVYFEDTLTNTVTLLNTSDYNLTATTDLIGTGRFYVRFEAETLSVLESNLNELQIYNNSDTKEIIVKGQLTEATSFVLYDIQGRAILRTDLDTSNVINTIDASNYSKGVYLVQLTDAVSTISKKLIIR
ncbi:reprolysin-like metallopeptidase [Psychroserpens sp.]|uniref:reprolysin-like metallopeptidase n=1 Tax=Psychroserpens sp. TaxID=2020870 RepID=UPI002B27B886|nr:zinc-dependent metalloprotease family protein [Psychroserpens sp.]